MNHVEYEVDTVSDDSLNGARTVDYKWESSEATSANLYLFPAIHQLLKIHSPAPSNVFDLGCGNGYIANLLKEGGWSVTGIDGSLEGIQRAKAAHPELDVHVASVYDDLRAKYGQFSAVISLEVVEHLYAPREYARRLFELMAPGGVALISTPYHGYWKNLALAITGHFDRHFTALWDNGHIKFWSKKTLRHLFEESSLDVVDWKLVGRIPIFAKSMIAVVRHSEDGSKSRCI